MDQFPRFADGDVTIVAPTGHSWKLHSHILSQFSPTFRNLLRDSGHISKKHKGDKAAGPQWKLSMTVTNQHEFYVDFRLVDLSVKQTLRLPVSLNGKGSIPQYLISYDNLFRCFYNLDPDLVQDDGAGANSLTHQSVHLVQAAERIGALATVRRMIESHLLRLGQTFWLRVIALPHLFADLAIRLESPAIFKEAMIHVVGTYNMPDGVGSMDLDGSSIHARLVKEIALAKHLELDELKEEVELRLVQFVPNCLKKAVVGGKIPGRSDYDSDIYLWQAHTLVRQHITMALIQKQGRLAKDGGTAFYRQLNNGGDSYLRPQALVAFLLDFPMTKKAEKVFYEAIVKMKEEYKHLTAELMVNNGQPFAANAPHLGYMTLANITEDDYPWESTKKVTTTMQEPPDTPQRTITAGEGSSSKRTPKEPRVAAPIECSASTAKKSKRTADEAFGEEEEEPVVSTA